MSIETLNFRKCRIESVANDHKTFTVRDLYDDSEKILYPTGKQLFFHLNTYKAMYKAGDIVYAAEGANNKWKLVSEYDYTRREHFAKLKRQFDKLFDR